MVKAMRLYEYRKHIIITGATGKANVHEDDDGSPGRLLHQASTLVEAIAWIDSH